MAVNVPALLKRIASIKHGNHKYRMKPSEMAGHYYLKLVERYGFDEAVGRAKVKEESFVRTINLYRQRLREEGEGNVSNG